MRMCKKVSCNFTKCSKNLNDWPQVLYYKQDAA